MLSFVSNPYRISPDLFEEKRHKFSSYLPYAAWDPKTGIYYNKDDTLGFIFRCIPRVTGGESLETNIASLLKIVTDIPKSTLSFSLVSSPDINRRIEDYKNLKARTATDPLLKMAIDKYANFLLNGVKGLPHMLGTPIRDFQVYIAFKMPEKETEKVNIHELKTTFYESLRGCYLNPMQVQPDELIRFLFLLLNGKTEDVEWDQARLISDQVILADTKIKVHKDMFQAGPNFFQCLTPKHIAPEVSLDKTGNISGERRGPIDDSNQVPCHFIFTTVYAYDPKIANLIRSKATFFKRQAEGEDSILNKVIGEYAQEHLEAVDHLEKGKSYLYSMPMIWLWSDSRESLKNAVERTKRLMRRQGFVPQTEEILLTPMFISALPFGLYQKGNNIQTLERYFIATENQNAALAPIVADYSGGGSPQMFFVSRKGQLISFDPFDKAARNKNLCVMGTTGGGKSFVMNLYVLSMYASGAIVRIFDLGYSYQKLCKLLKGDYIDPSERKICLNPFSFVPDDCDHKELIYHLDSIAALLGAAAYADTEEEPTQSMKNLLRGAVQYAWEVSQKNADIELVYEYLASFPKLTGEELKELCKNEDSQCKTDLARDAHHLAFNLANWMPGGNYEGWFTGPANVDLVSCPFIVVELEHLRRTPALLKVISLAVVNAVTSVMYLMPRKNRKVVLFEECGITLKGNELFKAVVEEAYRRGRKNNVSTATVFQSPLDLQKLGDVGEVILANADYHMYLPSPDYVKAIKEKVLPLEGYEETLASINSALPRYSEIGLRTPYGVGVARVLVDNFMYWLSTSEPNDWTRIQEMMKQVQEKREHPRHDVIIPAYAAQKNKDLNIVNVSEAGCQVLDPDGEPLPPGGILDLVFNLEEGNIKVRCKVMHTGTGNAMGLKFAHFYEGQDLYQKFIASLKKVEQGFSRGGLIKVITQLEQERNAQMASLLGSID